MCPGATRCDSPRFLGEKVSPDLLVDVVVFGSIAREEATTASDMVGLLPSGAQALMARRDWSLAMCLRVAESLDVEVHPSVAPRGRA